MSRRNWETLLLAVSAAGLLSCTVEFIYWALRSLSQ